MSIKEAIDPLNISGSNVRDLLLKGKTIPRHIMRSPIQEMLYSELANGKQLFYE
jgi:ATP sulfurylase